ncbi:trypsin-1-like [Cydia pomonella]|uniref:trypsin-1-like n=1 Tax=Cydia pomonella TaxID=82600 RepID=UPI002ADD32C2|nr:trypsin-1-like [Cydia pomonella]
MLSPVVFLYLFVTPYALGNDLSSRILFGQRANIKEFPYFAALQECGAVIISDSWLVTTAHCVAFNDHKFGTVWVGGNNAKTSKQVTYDTVVIHPEFNIADQFLSNDIALLRLSEPLTFSHTIQPVGLPHDDNKGYYGSDQYVGVTHTVAGKGMREGNLLKVDVMPISTEECLSHLSLAARIYMYKYRYRLHEYICATRETHNDYEHDMPGLSQGASGSPLVHQGELAGLAVAVNDPWQSNLFTFIKITRHTEWIRFITGIRSDHPGDSTTNEPAEEYEGMWNDD